MDIYIQIGVASTIQFLPNNEENRRYMEIKTDIAKILRKLNEYKLVEIIEASICVEYIHMMVNILPK